jgi:hypothetical protein
MKLLSHAAVVDLEVCPAVARLQMTVSVDATRLAEEAAGAGADVRVFALVPEQHEGGIEWVRHELPHAYSWRLVAGGGATIRYDVHALGLSGSTIEAASLDEAGIALGLETEAGTIWLQTQGDNYRPRRI